MHRFKTIAFLAITLGSMVWASCAKEKPDPDEQPADTEKPTLEWIVPLASMYPVGAQVSIHFTVLDNMALSGLTLTVSNSTIDSVYVQKTYVSDEKTLEVDEKVSVNLTTTMADFIVKIEATDKAGNKDTFLKGFHVMD